MIRVLIAEDSPVVRMHLKNILEEDPDISVVGMAENGEDAVRLVQELQPDVVTMDINMPGTNGHVATRRIMETNPVPIVVVTASYDPKDVRKSFMAMEAGAVAILEKPVGKGHPYYDEEALNFVRTVKLMSEVKVVKRWPRRAPAPADSSTLSLEMAGRDPDRPSSKNIKIVVIGASTGGPPVLQTILSGLNAKFPVPVIVVQHIAKGFLDGMVAWLSQTTHHPVHAAAGGERLLPGHVYFAPDDMHVGISGGQIELSGAEPENGIRPSVSYLFRSAIRVFGPDIVGVLLTGMGKDGAEELKLMKELGAITIAQDRESSVVYGMPGEAVRLGAATYVFPPEKIARALEDIVRLNKTHEEVK
ncbi:MAG: chemotaxis-specific protein-glutamate methyltransferase CheB [Deltaproteobacteria bacterium]|nr:chemotaxis-specific protein-glutamate methyltransferase CheB [Deltaproteobacteria bacterium]